MQTWQGKWALVTGASAGIGRAFAARLAAGGTHLVLTARRRERLEQLAHELRSKHSVQVETFPADLGQPSAPQQIFEFAAAKGIAIELLINNAGFGAYGELPRIPLARLLEMVQVNVAAVVANHDSTGSKPAGNGSATATKRRSFVRSRDSVTRTRSPAL